MKNQTQTLEQASVKQYCKAVRVSVIGANFVTLAEQAVKENQSHTRYLEALLAMESEERDWHAIENRIRELAEGGYIERSEPVVLIGECGTGKSHLATGPCLAACRQKRRVRFTTAAALVNESVEAKQNGQVKRAVARWMKYDLIALDEVGYVPLERLTGRRPGISAMLTELVEQVCRICSGKEGLLAQQPQKRNWFRVLRIRIDWVGCWTTAKWPKRSSSAVRAGGVASAALSRRIFPR